MKTLFIEYYGLPYKIVLSDAILKKVQQAQRSLQRLPWKGEMFIPVDALRLGVSGDTERVKHAEIGVGKDHVSVFAEGPDGREILINPDDNILNIDDIYLSFEFYIYLEDFVFSLSESEIELVEKWKLLKNNIKYGSMKI